MGGRGRSQPSSSPTGLDTFRVRKRDQGAHKKLRDSYGLDSAIEQSMPTGSSSRGSDGMDGSFAPRRAPYPERPLDPGHQRDVGFVSSALQKVTQTTHQRSHPHTYIHKRNKTHHHTKFLLRVLPPASGGVRVRKGGFVPSSDAIWVASPERVPEPGPCPRGGGGGARTTT